MGLALSGVEASEETLVFLRGIIVGVVLGLLLSELVIPRTVDVWVHWVRRHHRDG